jgi:hypothetical protein
MVDFQSISITLAAFSFAVAATYYAMNLREVARNRRITLTTTLLQNFMTGEGYGKILDLTSMEWDNIEDFMSKYDHRVDRDNAARRMALWNTCNTIGSLYREGMLDLKTIFTSSGGIINSIWIKFKPIIEYYRETDYTDKAYEDFEYLAKQLEQYM